MPHLILGAMFRALGAYPSGWRYPGAHNNPRNDVAILRHDAKLAEDACLDYLFFGDWLATGHDLEFRDPYLLARIDPLSAITFAAGITERIGLIATANTTYSDPYTLARATASVDLLSGGRAGLNLVTGAEPRAAGNHGQAVHADNDARYDRAEEFVAALRSLWDSFEDDAFVRDAEAGVLLDPAKLHATDLTGRQISVTGPLNAARPVQGHLPIVNAGTSPRSRRLVAEHADLALVAVPDLERAVALRGQLLTEAAAAGRNPDQLKIITPILPVVAETTAAAWAIVDTLLDLIPVDEGDGEALPATFPPNRTLAALADTLGTAPDGRTLSDEVSAELAAGFSDEGRRLLRLLTSWTGREVGSHRPITLRQLLVASTVPANFVVGDGGQVADHLQRWFEAGAVDGFNILTAIRPAQFEAFTELVVPELQRRGLFRTAYEGTTLREHLGLDRPANVHLTTAPSVADARESA
jgi:FMN-dependent oxidoreductase (nitrilotriacetate monooxygenase family)